MNVLSLRSCASVLFLLLFVSAPVWAIPQSGKESKSSGKRSFTLVFEGNTVSADIKEVSLEEVLMEVAQQTDFSIDVDGSITDEKVSVVFDSLPVEEGLHALLRNKNYSLMYSKVVPAAGSDPQFKVEGMKIVGKGYGPPPPIFRAGFERETPRLRPVEEERPTGSPVVSNKSADERIDDLDELASEQEMAALPLLLQAANSDPDPRVREYAQELIEQVKEGEE